MNLHKLATAVLDVGQICTSQYCYYYFFIINVINLRINLSRVGNIEKTY